MSSEVHCMQSPTFLFALIHEAKEERSASLTDSLRLLFTAGDGMFVLDFVEHDLN